MFAAHSSCSFEAVYIASVFICEHRQLQHVHHAMSSDDLSCMCSGTEQRFMQASMAATAGKPIITDEEYDDLKAQLRNKNSVVVQQVRLAATGFSARYTS